VFCTKIKTVNFVVDFLKRQNIRVTSLTGEMPQAARERALAEFRAGKFTALVATDVAGRGIHLNALEHIVNYDFPPSLSQYAHRVGRAGRGPDKKGTAFSFFTRNLRVMAPDLVKMLQAAGQEVDHHLKRLSEEVDLLRGSGGGEIQESMNKEEALLDSDDEDDMDEKVQPSEGEGGTFVSPVQQPGEPLFEDNEGEQDLPTLDGAHVRIVSLDAEEGDDNASNDDDDVNCDTEVYGAIPLARFEVGGVLGRRANQGGAVKAEGGVVTATSSRKRPRGKRGGKKHR